MFITKVERGKDEPFATITLSHSDTVKLYGWLGKQMSYEADGLSGKIYQELERILWLEHSEN